MHVSVYGVVSESDLAWVNSAVEAAIHSAHLCHQELDRSQCLGSVYDSDGRDRWLGSLKQLTATPGEAITGIKRLLGESNFGGLLLGDIRPLGWQFTLESVVADSGATHGGQDGCVQLKIRIPPGPGGREQGDATTELLRSLVSLNIMSGGVVHDDSAGLGYGSYSNAAVGRDETYRLLFSGTVVLDYCWQMLLPPQVLAKLGGPERFEATAPVEYAEILRWPSGATGALARVGPEPTAITDPEWRQWREYLEPVLPAHSQTPRVLGPRPSHIQASDWTQVSQEQLRKELGL